MIRGFVLLCFLLAPLAQSQQHTNFQGVWRLRESAAPSETFILVSEEDGRLGLKTFSGTGSRYTLTDAEFVVGTEQKGTLQRMPARFKAMWEGDALVLDWAAEWPWGEQSAHHRWVMNADNQSFHDESTDTFKTRVRPHSLTFERAPADAGKVFDYPEQNSGDHFQNVRLLKELPSSALTPLMGTYQAALGVDCAFCHNQSAYESDEKAEKKMAREMISMTADMNRRQFAGRTVITCFTCHRGQTTPATQ